MGKLDHRTPVGKVIVMDESSSVLVSRFITADYCGMEDQRACAIELLTRIQRGDLTLSDAIELIRNREPK